MTRHYVKCVRQTVPILHVKVGRVYQLWCFCQQVTKTPQLKLSSTVGNLLSLLAHVQRKGRFTVSQGVLSLPLPSSSGFHPQVGWQDAHSNSRCGSIPLKKDKLSLLMSLSQELPSNFSPCLTAHNWATSPIPGWLLVRGVGFWDWHRPTTIHSLSLKGVSIP